MLGRDARKHAFSMSSSRVFTDRGDLRLTSSRPGDREAEVELALIVTDNLDIFATFSESIGIRSAELLCGISFRLVVILFRQTSDAMGGGGAGLLATSCLWVATSRRFRSLAAAVERSIVLMRANG